MTWKHCGKKIQLALYKALSTQAGGRMGDGSKVARKENPSVLVSDRCAEIEAQDPMLAFTEQIEYPFPWP